MPRKIYLQLGSTQSVKGGSLWVHNLHSELQDSQNQDKKTLEIKQNKRRKKYHLLTFVFHTILAKKKCFQMAQ